MENWLARTKFLMDKKKITRANLAKKLGITVSQVGHYLNGRREPPLAKQKIIANALEITFEELHSNFDGNSKNNCIQPTARYIPVVDWVCAGPRAVTTKSQVDENKMIPVSNSMVSSNGYALIVKGDSMRSSYIGEKSFFPGEIIIVDPEKIPYSGDYVIAIIKPADVAIFRQYVEEGSDKYLKPLNIQYPVIPFAAPAKIIGVVVSSINNNLCSQEKSFNS